MMWSSKLTIAMLIGRKLQPLRAPVFTAFRPYARSGSRSYSLSKCWQAKSSISNPLQAYVKPARSKGLDRNVPSGGLFLLIIPVSTLCLGIWQVYRWRWKLGLINDMRLNSIADPVPLPFDLSEIEKLEYQKVKVSGEFDYSKEVLIGPRSLVDLEDHSKEGRGVFSSGSQNKNGYLVITPFKLNGTDEAILVNRGWISSRDYQKFRHITGPVDLVGIVRKNEPRAPFMSKNRAGTVLFHYRDVPTMAGMLGSEEVFVDLFSIDGVDFSKAREESIPVPKQTRVTLRNEHVSYFITWFSLSTITSFMWYRRFVKGLPLL